MNLLSVITELLGFVCNLLCSSKCRACRGFCISTSTPYGALKTVCRHCWTEISSNSPPLNWLSVGREDIVVASGSYFLGPTKKLIYHLKYDGDVRLANDLSLLLFIASRKLNENKRIPAYVSTRTSRNAPAPCPGSLSSPLANCIIVPIPMHRERYQQRGYNQAELLASKLGTFINVPVIPQALSRVINTAPQYGLSRKQRRENLRGAFSANPDLVKDRDIIIVDDIFTSGATICEAAAELFRNGANSVRAITLARAI